MKCYSLGKQQGAGMIANTVRGNLNRIRIQKVIGLGFIVSVKIKLFIKNIGVKLYNKVQTAIKIQKTKIFPRAPNKPVTTIIY